MSGFIESEQIHFTLNLAIAHLGRLQSFDFFFLHIFATDIFFISELHPNFISEKIFIIHHFHCKQQVTFYSHPFLAQVQLSNAFSEFKIYPLTVEEDMLVSYDITFY